MIDALTSAMSSIVRNMKKRNYVGAHLWILPKGSPIESNPHNVSIFMEDLGQYQSSIKYCGLGAWQLSLVEARFRGCVLWSQDAGFQLESSSILGGIVCHCHTRQRLAGKKPGTMGPYGNHGKLWYLAIHLSLSKISKSFCFPHW